MNKAVAAMPDPFDALRQPVRRVDPDPSFTENLRARVERALQLPKGVTVSDIDVDVETALAERIQHGDAGYASLWVPDLERGQRFYSAVLGWPGPGQPVHRPPSEPGGLQQGMASPDDLAYSTLMIAYGVDDLDASLDTVASEGGTAEPPTTETWGRTAMCADPDGIRFALYELPSEDGRGPRPAANGSASGDLAYVTMSVHDSARSRQFYGAVLGWTFTPGHAADGWQVTNTVPMTGLHGGADRPRVVPMYLVHDIRAAVRKVTDAGGTATEPQLQPYGWTSTCEDDQGTAFYLGQL